MNQAPDYQHFAAELADAARIETLRYFRKTPLVDNKLTTGFDPVTKADKGAEAAIRKLIEARFPDHGIRGEEFSDKPANCAFTWILDPVDGTRAFISGLPVWGVLIGLLENDRPVLGLLDQPFTGERFYADGKTAIWTRQRAVQKLACRKCTSLSIATLCTTDPYLFNASEKEGYEALRNATRLQRYGLDCYAYGALALGQVDLVVESGLQDFDIAPLIAIIEGAGGIVSTWAGGDAGKGGQIIAAGSPQVYEQAMQVLRPLAGCV